MKKTLFIGMVLSLLMLCGAAFAQDTDYERNSLAGISSFCVIVEEFSDAGTEVGLTQENMAASISAVLDNGGIVVTDDIAVCDGLVYANINVLRISVGDELMGYAANIVLEVEQKVTLKRNGEYYPNAATWNEMFLTITTQADAYTDIRNYLNDLTGELVSDYTTAN